MRGGDCMKKSFKIALVAGAVILSLGLISTCGIKGDPPYGLINLK